MTSLKCKAFPETINLEDQSNYRLNEISKVKNCFNEEIQYQQSSTNKLSKYLTILDYSNKILTVFLTVFHPLISLLMLKVRKNY